jgi:hypothetical protein
MSIKLWVGLIAVFKPHILRRERFGIRKVFVCCSNFIGKFILNCDNIFIVKCSGLVLTLSPVLVNISVVLENSFVRASYSASLACLGVDADATEAALVPPQVTKLRVMTSAV